MSLLILAPNLETPSHLWMRRTLEELSGQVSTIVTNKQLNNWACEGVNVQVLPETPTFLSRGLHRMGLIQRSPWHTYQSEFLKKLIDRPDISAVVIHYLNQAVALQEAIINTRKPVFIWCHGNDVTWDMQVAETGERLHPMNYIELVRKLAAHAKFIANSHATRQRLMNIGVREEQIEVLYFGMPPAEMIDRSGRDECTFLYLGRLVDFKGPELTIAAFDLACDQGLQGKLLIAGDGPLRKACEQARRDSCYRDRIQLIGTVDAESGTKLRAEVDVFTAHNRKGPQTNQEEAFGVAFIEAMAAGLPVISGCNGSLPEIMQDGVHGILFPPGDIAAHAEALLKLEREKELRLRLGETARQHALNQYSLERESNQLRTILGISEAA
ncbi:glycosyltransferase family 4 protein [Calycomorphotria hydatis]|uniref:Alpha-D-kanosaminyltransferase n=1 Tax=Calycomorphotria hydatis TaxID=2528027 RepID=A0A517T3E7_9PLAN|nr:glycosyltransferase family 4 protein [Calycomorphotria hydatis]QDT62889.1 Alpha-D-kanosaminyltransferase [Calycomorphotria hydatis]